MLREKRRRATSTNDAVRKDETKRRERRKRKDEKSKTKEIRRIKKIPEVHHRREVIREDFRKFTIIGGKGTFEKVQGI